MSSEVEIGDGDEHSVCSSVGAPPFAFLSDPSDSMFQSQLQSQISHNKYPNIVTKALTSPCARSSMTAETERTAPGSSFFDSPSQDAVYEMTYANYSLHESQTIDFDDSASLLAAHRIEAIGSIIASESGSFHLPPRHPNPNSRSMGFSELMRKADDQNQPTMTDGMPTLLYSSQQQSASSVLTPRATNQSWLPRSQDDSISGPSRLLSRGVQIDQVGEDSFQVVMQVGATTNEVMHVLGNPDLLQLWCESVQNLVVTRSSEQRKNTSNRRDTSGEREYDGEWVEASTSTLISPAKGGCLGSTLHTIRTQTGFPLWGRINMFVERRRGQVSLTIGPFAGGVTAYHVLDVHEYQGITSITDRVRIGKETRLSPSPLSSSSSTVFLCGVGAFFRRCVEPSIDGHMDQALASMTKLRVLVEHGESGIGGGLGILGSAEIEGELTQSLLS